MDFSCKRLFVSSIICPCRLWANCRRVKAPSTQMHSKCGDGLANVKPARGWLRNKGGEHIGPEIYFLSGRKLTFA